MTTLPSDTEKVKTLTNSLPREKPLGDLLREAQRTLVVHLERALSVQGFADVGAAHVSLLSLVEPEGTRLAALAERGGRTKQASAELTAHLVKRGYLDLAADPTDGRAKLYRLTASGDRLLEAGAAIVDGYDEWLRRTLGRDGIKRLRSALDTIIEHG